MEEMDPDLVFATSALNDDEPAEPEDEGYSSPEGESSSDDNTAMFDLGKENMPQNRKAGKMDF